MKNLLIALAVLSWTSAFAAESKLVLSCRNTSHLPSGFSLSITSDGLAHFTDRDNLGPFVDLGSTPVNGASRGGEMVYTGANFNLEINRDYDQTDAGYPSQVYYDSQGRVFNEPMICNYASQM